MAFQQKEWKNRLSEHPTRRTLTKLGEDADTMLVEVAREEGTIMQQGDPFSAANMNDLEQRIADGIGGGDENMAPIEEGPESENAYAVGQLLIYEGQLYRVISAIAVGNTLVEDVNIEATTISNEFVGELTANGNRLYMDYKNGKYGYNTSPTRGADTFFPFNRADHIRLNLYGYAYGWAAMYGTDAEAHTTGSGTYKLSGVEIDHITGISGSMTVSYTNGQGQSVSQSLSAGQTVSIGNSNDVTFSWQNSASQHKHSSSGDASCSVSASVVVDVYF